MSLIARQSHASPGTPLWSPSAVSTSAGFTPQNPEIWQGSPPTSLADAVNRLSMIVYGRTAESGLLPMTTADTNVVISSNGIGGNFDVLVTKYTTAGDVQWITRIAGLAGDVGRAITTDSSGNVYVTGDYNVGATIFNADGTIFGTLSTSGSSDAFIIKYNTNGMCQWSTRVAGSASDLGNAISVDSSGNVLVTGRYDSNPVTFFNADGTIFGTLVHQGQGDAYIVKYNTNGMCQWSTRVSGTPGIEIGQGVSVDVGGNVFVTGRYSANPVTIFNADGTIFGTLDNVPNTSSTFILKYNPNGICSWGTRLSGISGSTSGNAISVDADGNMCVIGDYSSNPITIFNADGTTFGTLTASGNIDVFVLKYNTNGMCQWSTRIAGSTVEQGTAIDTDSSGNILVTGSFSGSPSIFNADGTIFGTLPISASGTSRNVFLVKYSPNGMGQWFTRIVGNAEEDGRSISVDPSGNVLVGVQSSSSDLVTSAFNADGSLFTVNLGSSLVKYSTEGQGLWVVRFPFSAMSAGISTDTSGNIYTIGSSGFSPLIFRSAGL